MCLVSWGRRRRTFYNQVSNQCPRTSHLIFTIFQNLSNHVQFIFHRSSCKDRQILTWLGKSLHESFDIGSIKKVCVVNSVTIIFYSACCQMYLTVHCVSYYLSVYTGIPNCQAVLNIHVVERCRIFFPHISDPPTSFRWFVPRVHMCWYSMPFRTLEYVHLCPCYITMNIESIVSTRHVPCTVWSPNAI